MSILYSQCWEDPQLLSESLRVQPSDDVLSIASAGDNSFALLLDGPRSLTVVDSHPEQLYLVELKMAATRLSYEDYIRFLGVRTCPDRMELYRAIRLELSLAARRYWDAHQHEIRGGVIHCGRLERYLSAFRCWVLPLVHTRTLIERLLTSVSLAEQKQLYCEHWDRKRWRWFFRFFFSQKVMSRFGRNPSWFDQVTQPDVGAVLLERTRCGLTNVPTPSNYFLEYMLTGTYRNLDCAPPYLCRNQYESLRAKVNQVSLECCSLGDLFGQTSAGSFSCFNLSDVFEYMTPENADATWQQVVQSARPGSRVAYRTLFVPRQPPTELAARLHELERDRYVGQGDRTFFYDAFRALEVA